MKIIDKLACPPDYDCRNCINSREHNVGYHCSIHAILSSVQGINMKNRHVNFSNYNSSISICEDYNPK